MPASRAIIEMVATIMSYRFEQLSQRDIEAMLDITLQETRLYRELREGRQEEAVYLTLRLLRKRFGELSEELQASVLTLPLSELEELSEAVLDFTNLADLQGWLTERAG